MLDFLNTIFVENVILVILIASLIFTVVFGFMRIKSHANGAGEFSFIFLFLKYAQKPLAILTICVFASVILTQSQFTDIEISQTISKYLNRAFIIIITWIVICGMRAFRDKSLRGYDISTADNLYARKRHTQLNVLYRVLVFIVILISISLVLMTFDGVTDIGKSLLASAGVAGIILGFAAQKTIGSVFAGIQIAITQPIRIEDAVVVEGEWGWIEEITLTYIVIRIWDLRRLIVPITYFIETPFQNWTRNEAEIIGTVVINTDYNVPVDEMRKELDRLLESTDLWNGRVKVLQVIDTTESTVTLRALMTGKNSPTTWDLRCFVREGLIKWLGENYPEALPRTRVKIENIQPNEPLGKNI